MIVKLYPQKNDFWAPDRDWTCNLLMTRAQDREPRWKFDIYVWPKQKQLNLCLGLRNHFSEDRAWWLFIYHMIFPSSHTSNIWISSISLLIYSGFSLGHTYMSNLHLGSPSESWLVRVFHHSSEGCGFDLPSGAQKSFFWG